MLFIGIVIDTLLAAFHINERKDALFLREIITRLEHRWKEIS